jgi:hypothetical protein
LMGTRMSVEATLMLVPPMSMTRTFIEEGYRVWMGNLVVKKMCRRVVVFDWGYCVFRGVSWWYFVVNSWWIVW